MAEPDRSMCGAGRTRRTAPRRVGAARRGGRRSVARCRSHSGSGRIEDARHSLRDRRTKSDARRRATLGPSTWCAAPRQRGSRPAPRLAAVRIGRSASPSSDSLGWPCFAALSGPWLHHNRRSVRDDRPMTTRVHVAEWLAEYERAWRAPGTGGLGRLFSDEASYQLDPYEPRIKGLEQIASMWSVSARGPTSSSRWTARSSRSTATRRWSDSKVHYDGPSPNEYRDLWILEFDQAGRCRSFEEWPFWPGRPRVDPPSA